MEGRVSAPARFGESEVFFSISSRFTTWRGGPVWPARLGELVTCFILFSMLLLCFLTYYLFLDIFLTRRIRRYDVTRSPCTTKITRKRTIVVNTMFSTQAFCFTNHACPEDYLAKSSPDRRVIKIGQEWFEAPECVFQPHLVNVDQPSVAGEQLSTRISALC